MSGGSYDYKYKELNNLADLIDTQPRDENQLTRKRVALALRELADICHDIEWIDSGDYEPEDWNKIIEWLDKHNF